MKVLVTGGATCERIDDVRHITNMSSGKTAVNICEFFAEQGAEVFYLHGKNAILPTNSSVLSRSLSFLSFFDLNQLIEKMLGEVDFDAVIHLAAVGDYSVETVIMGDKKYDPNTLAKIDSQETVTIKLKRNFKILNKIKEYDRFKKTVVVGFKLTNTLQREEREAAITKLLKNGGVDYVVHNDLHEINSECHVTNIYNNKQEWLKETKTKSELAKYLYELLRKLN